MLLLWMLALCWKVVGSLDDFEMDTSLSSVVCRQCIQLWRVVAKDSRSTCGPHARTCTGNACFMRQCKHCPIYQYMSGCLTLTEWQLSDLAMSRQRAELLATRVGATLLCEDSANQTTCVCNRKDKCNDIHARAPFSTYTGNLFGGIINFDSAISKIDPRYGEMVPSKHAFQFYSSISSVISSTVLIWITILLNIFIQ
ncbi:Uncharacterized protein F46C5.2 [Toxocara canis]|uniref:Uncharacterized protein F46C5.2 n=2 Tax=Toxocara canis TaxID=6265 RepID=A0A0B2VP16_TOXCA|nr:Uncharacterized protein F46C5.2 [Toxocara canis]VDM23965.1 unnamed protein product [Toxocara canis]